MFTLVVMRKYSVFSKHHEDCCLLEAMLKQYLRWVFKQIVREDISLRFAKTKKTFFSFYKLWFFWVFLIKMQKKNIYIFFPVVFGLVHVYTSQCITQIRSGSTVLRSHELGLIFCLITQWQARGCPAHLHATRPLALASRPWCHGVTSVANRKKNDSS